MAYKDIANIVGQREEGGEARKGSLHKFGIQQCQAKHYRKNDEF